MKLLVLFLVAFSINISATVYSQQTKISLNIHNQSIKEALLQIEDQSEFRFIFENEKTNLDKKINIKATDKRVEDILDQLFKDENINYVVTENNTILINPQTSSVDAAKGQASVKQENIASGEVKDENGATLPGVSIIIRGSSKGTVTDLDGKFSIEAPIGSVLEFSYTGYNKTSYTVTSRAILRIVMTENTQLIDEVVVVGYGIQKKETLTGSVVAVKGDQLVKSPAANVVNSLAGRLPGVIINNRSGEPGQENVSVNIRGRSTTGNTSALIIIDGVERDGLSMINPNDIESISVLKDASAAIYGARAANGVILVTTKRGTSSKPVISLSYDQSFTRPTRSPKMADSYTFASVYNEIEEMEGRASRYTDDELRKFQDGSDPNYTSTNWYDYMTRNLSPQHRTNLSVSGAGERVKYYISFGELGQEGQYIKGTTDYKQYNIRSNVDVAVTKDLTVGMNLSGRYDKKHYPYWNAKELNSHMFLYQPDWQMYWPGTNYLKPNRDNESIMNWVNDNAGTVDSDTKTVQSSLFFKWDVPWVKGLSIDGNGSYDAVNVHPKWFQTPDYVYYKNETTGELYEGLSGKSPKLAKLRDRMESSTAFYLNAKINYNRSFGNHNVGGLLGYEQMQTTFNFIEASRSDFLSTSIPQLFAGSSDKYKQGNDGSATQDARQNFFGRLSYDYAGKYLAQFTLRRDGSSNFATTQRYGTFPSVSAGWRISEESFMENANFINNLKIRGSYGKMGNDRVNPFQYLLTYGFKNNYVIGGTDVSGLGETNVPNPNITWETAKTWNIGLDANLWNGLLGIEFDYFKTRRSNILTKRSAVIPSYTGLELPDENVGIVDNKGFELTLTHENHINKDFTYSVSGNVSFARNKVIFSDEQPAAEPYQMATGRPIGSSLYYKALGIFKDQAAVDNYPHLSGTVPGDIIYEDVNGDKIIDSRDRIRENMTRVPEIVYGFQFYVKYKAFDLSLLFQGQENAKQSFGEGSDLDGNNLAGWFPVMSYSFGNFLQWRADDRWSPEHTDATMPRGSYSVWNNSTSGEYNSTQWLVDAGFLRLRNIEIGYSVPRSVCEKLKIVNLRLSASASNLFLVYDHMKKMGFDPETTDYWYYQPQKTFNAGVNLTF